MVTLTDRNPVFKVTAFLKSNISKTARFRDKVTRSLMTISLRSTAESDGDRILKIGQRLAKLWAIVSCF